MRWEGALLGVRDVVGSVPGLRRATGRLKFHALAGRAERAIGTGSIVFVRLVFVAAHTGLLWHVSPGIVLAREDTTVVPGELQRGRI